MWMEHTKGKYTNDKWPTNTKPMRPEQIASWDRGDIHWVFFWPLEAPLKILERKLITHFKKKMKVLQSYKANPQTDSTDCMTLKISVSNDFHSILREQTLIFCLFWWKLRSSRHKGKGPDRPWWRQWRWKRWYCSWWEPWQWQWWRWDNGIDIGDDNIYLLEMMTMRNLKTEQLRGAGFDNAKKGTR